ncbi:copper chaperone PCu(A)C [Streptomyces swartbergensis]|uniref:copper chaperone PCu(A)C n=1 Tax=Streptomyces swartbergensis TaxID=487165 RepID=UPI0038128300
MRTGRRLSVCAARTGYTATGAAGDPPPRIEVVEARIIAPMGARSTAAYFEIRNTGSSPDTLQYADSPDLGISIIRRTVRRTGTGRTEPAWAVDVPAGGTVRMTPGGLGVVILDPPALKPGQSVRYNLWFRYSGRVGVRVPVTASPS